MLTRKHIHRHLLAVLLIASMILSGLSVLSFADSGSSITFSKLRLGSKKAIEFKPAADGSLTNQYFKVTIPRKGMYKMYIYDSYNKDSREDFYYALYGSASAVSSGSSIGSESGLHNDNSTKTDYELYYLKKGTYYIKGQFYNASHNKSGLKIVSVKPSDLLEVSLGGNYYVGMNKESVDVAYYDFHNGGKRYEGKISSVTSSNTKVAKIRKESYTGSNGKKVYMYYMSCKKVGSAKITVKYTRPDGKKATKSVTIKVKKYPKPITSLKVGGKTISLTKHKFEYELRDVKSTSTSVSIKMGLKSGWKIDSCYANWFGSSSSYDATLNKSKIKSGKAINFPKRYDTMIVQINLKDNKGNDLRYVVYVYREIEED